MTQRQRLIQELSREIRVRIRNGHVKRFEWRIASCEVMDSNASRSDLGRLYDKLGIDDSVWKCRRFWNELERTIFEEL